MTTSDEHRPLRVAVLVTTIPGVCAEAPGLVSSLDLPLTLPVTPFAADRGA